MKHRGRRDAWREFMGKDVKAIVDIGKIKREIKKDSDSGKASYLRGALEVIKTLMARPAAQPPPEDVEEHIVLDDEGNPIESARIPRGGMVTYPEIPKDIRTRMTRDARSRLTNFALDVAEDTTPNSRERVAHASGPKFKRVLSEMRLLIKKDEKVGELSAKIIKLAPDVARGRKLKKRNQGMAGKGGKATARYTDKYIIAAFKACKARCQGMSLNSAMTNMIEPIRGGAEYLEYESVDILARRLQRLVGRHPSKWWNAL
jgi:hypothetical protein